MMAALVQMFVRFYTQCFAVQFLVSLWDLTAADGGGWRMRLDLEHLREKCAECLIVIL